MKQRSHEYMIYIGATLPLIAGTLIFFYWYYQRNYHAIHVDIELISFFTILAYLLFGFVAIIQCILYYARFQHHWRRLIPALFIILFTIPAIITYGIVHDMNADITYVRIINDAANSKVVRIWSENFEVIDLRSKNNDIVVSYEPTYVYDWEKPDSFGYEYEMNGVYIDVTSGNNVTKTLRMPDLEKGMCSIVKVSDLMLKKR